MLRVISLLICMILFVPLTSQAQRPHREEACATCYGDADCRACKNCRYCKHCAKEGGTCGVDHPSHRCETADVGVHASRRHGGQRVQFEPLRWLRDCHGRHFGRRQWQSTVGVHGPHLDCEPRADRGRDEPHTRGRRSSPRVQALPRAARFHQGSDRPSTRPSPATAPCLHRPG